MLECLPCSLIWSNKRLPPVNHKKVTVDQRVDLKIFQLQKRAKMIFCLFLKKGPCPKKLPMMNIKEEQQQQQQAPSILTYYSVNSFTLWGLLGVVIFARKLNNYPLSFFGYSYLNSKCKLLGKWGGICQCYCQPLLLTYIPMHVVGGWGAKRSLGY